jgi:hypothetical protein
MRRQIAASCTAVLAIAAGSLFAIAQQPAGGKDRQVNTSIKDLMESIIDPSADVIWGASGTIIEQGKSTIEQVPRSDDEWLDVRRAAVRIIEGSNLLTTPGRAAAPPGTKSETPGVELEPAEISALITRNRPGFNSFAVALRTLGWEALQASEAKNSNLLLDIGGRMQEVCEGCHQTFWYPSASPPP